MAVVGAVILVGAIHLIRGDRLPAL